MKVTWTPIEGAFAVSGSRASGIDTLWRFVPDEERTPARRKLIIALVDHIREYHAKTGDVAPGVPVKGTCPDCGCLTWDGLHRNGFRECVMAEVETHV